MRDTVKRSMSFPLVFWLSHYAFQRWRTMPKNLFHYNPRSCQGEESITSHWSACSRKSSVASLRLTKQGLFSLTHTSASMTTCASLWPKNATCDVSLSLSPSSTVSSCSLWRLLLHARGWDRALSNGKAAHERGDYPACCAVREPWRLQDPPNWRGTYCAQGHCGSHRLGVALPSVISC